MLPEGICGNCGLKMDARRKRITDKLPGRWCSKSACQQKRRNLQIIVDTGLNHLLEREFRLCFDRGTITCPACGSDRAVRNFAHPKPGGGRCEALSGVMPGVLGVGLAWPELIPEGQ